MSTSEVLFACDGPVAFLTFNRPEARNALTWPMYAALSHACDRVDEDPAVRVLVLRGSGGSFVAGTDINQFTAFRSGEDGLAYERRLDAVIDRLEHVKAATIAQVEGVAAGGGCVIALACDLRVCTPDARFGVPIARTLGNCLSAANYARLVSLIGPARTKDLMFTGRFVNAAEAQALGLVTRAAAAEDADTVTRELARTIAVNAPLTIHATKKAIRRLHARGLQDVDVDDLVSGCYESQDFREGVRAFLEKRPPRFSGY